jgi:hypothetical protein
MLKMLESLRNGLVKFSSISRERYEMDVGYTIVGKLIEVKKEDLRSNAGGYIVDHGDYWDVEFSYDGKRIAYGG